MNNDTSTAVALAEKTCNRCGRTKPIRQFRFRSRERNVRHSECSSCLNAYHRARRADAREGELSEYVQHLVGDPQEPINYQANSRSEVVLRAMISRFGGLNAFADTWYEFIRVAQVSGKHHLVLRSFEVLLRMMQMVDARPEVNPNDLSKEESDRYFERTFALMSVQYPEAAITALEELGYVVLDPPDPEGMAVELPRDHKLAATTGAMN